MSTARDPSELQTEIQRLQAELERMKLEEKVQQLEQQLLATKENANQLTDDGQDEEEYYDEEEIIEEEVIEEEEFVEETVEEEEDIFPTPVATQHPTKEKKRGGFFGRRKGKKPDASSNTSSAAAPNPEASETPDMHAALTAHEAATKTPPLQPVNENKPLPYKPRVYPKLPPSPAGQETTMEKIIGPHLYTGGKLIKASTLACTKDQELIMLYFGAKWQRECKSFFPLLKDFYCTCAADRQRNSIECVYIPSDRSLMEFKDIFARMPFPAMITGTSDLKNAMASQLKIIDMPTIVVMEASTGLIKTTYGAQDIVQIERNSLKQATALVEQWKAIPSISWEQVCKDRRLKHGNLQRDILYWA